MNKKITFFAVVTAVLLLAIATNVLAAVTVTAATGGGAVSADTNTTNGTATWTKLTGPTITETTSRSITPGSGTIVFTAPSGFSFNNATSVTATITRDSGSGSCFSFNSNTVTPATSTITYTIASRDSNGTICHVTFSNIQVRPTAGTPLASGNITNAGSNGSVPRGATNYGTLTEVAGAKNKLIYTTQPSAIATTSVDFATKPVITLEDQYGNTEVSDNASTITLSPVLSTQACGGTAGSGTLTSTPASGGAVTAGLMTYTAMQYSFGESIKICATSAGVTSALSNAVAVSNPVPTTTSISPTSTTAGGANFTLTVNGTNFVSNSSVRINGASRTTTFVSGSQLTATILASDITVGATSSITVVNPTPGGGTSNAQVLTINNPVPTLTSISPTSTNAGSSGFTLTLTGTNFNTSSSVRWNGSARVTTFVSSSSLTAAILTSDLTTPTTTAVTVVNPTPGGGTSAAQTFTINKIPTSITLSSSASSSVYGSSVTFTATVTPTTAGPPTGIVTFLDGATTLGTSTVNASGTTGIATFSTSTLSVGGSPHSITAAYGGDSNFATSTSSAFSQTITKKALTVTGVTASNKIYDATTTATLSGTPGTLVGIVDSDNVSLTGTAIGTFATSSVGNGITVTVSGQSLTGTQASNYSLTEPTTTANITAKNLTVTGITASNKVYDRTTSSTLTTSSASLVGVIAGDTVTLNTGFAVGTFATSSVGVGISVQVSGLTISGSSSGNYTLTQPTSTANITSKALTVSGITANNKVYDASTTASLTTSSASLVGVIAGDTVTLNTGFAVGTFATSSVGVGISVQVSGLTISGSSSGNYTLTQPTSTADITNPVPTTISINPTSTIAGGVDFTLTVNGTNFVGSSTVQINGSDRTTTFVTSTQVTATITAADIAVAGTSSIAVFDPTPGGGTSNAQVLTVLNNVPAITSITPTSTIAGGSGFTLTVNGTNFVSGSSTVNWNGSPRTTAFVSSTQLTATILSSDITVAGTSTITVTTPGGTSNSQTFTINNPVPTLSSISPTSTAAGSSGFTLTVNGTNFVASSTVNWNASPRTTSFVSSTQLTASILSSDVTATGTASVTVVSPTPGGGTSNPQTFTISSAASKFVILDPATSTVGNPLTITIQAEDINNQLAATYNGGVTLVASGTSVTGGGLVTLTNGVGTTTISTNIAQSVLLTLSDTQSTGFDVSSSKTATFVAGPTTAFTLNHPGSVSTGARAAYAVGRKDQFNNPTSVSSTIAYLYSTSTSTSEVFFDAATGGNQITSATISTGSTSTQFWYYDTVAGTFTITASDNPTAPDGAIGITDATDNLTVAAGAVKFIFANVSSTATAGDTVTFNVEAVDSFGAIDTSFNQDVTVTKTGSASGAPSGGGLVTIINGVGTSTLIDTLAETVTLALTDTQSTGLNVSSTASVTFVAGSTAKFSLNHPGNMNTGTRLGYTLSRKDQFNNPTSVSSTIAYLYSTSTSTSEVFFDAATGGNQITSATISTGSTSTQFWYYDTVAGTFTITASDNPTAPDGAIGITDATDNLTVAAGAVKFIFANVSSTATAGDTVTFNVEAVDSFGAIDTSFNQDVTVTKTGSASGGGLVDIVNGIATTTITDSVAENITLGLQDTQSTGLGVIDARTMTFAAVPTPTQASAPAIQLNVPIHPNPAINITFSGWAYPGASISLIRKDLGLLQSPILQTSTAAADGSFSMKLNKVLRLTGQTYILVFADKNGTVSETKAYNIPAGQENLVDNNMVIAPTVGFGGDAVINKTGSIIIQGYTTPKGTVSIFIDGNEVGTETVNSPSGQFRYVFSADNLAIGRHSVAAIQVYNNVQSDNSSQQSFTVSPLANPRLDLNGDGVIDIKDISIYFSYLKNLGAGVISFNTTDKNLLHILDLNGDGKLDIQDLSILLNAAGLKQVAP